MFGCDRVLSLHAYVLWLESHSSVSCTSLHLFTFMCVYLCCYFKLRRPSLTNEAAFSSGWKLNDNEYTQGVRDYVITEMEMQKSQDYWDGCLHATLLLPGFVYEQLN